MDERVIEPDGSQDCGPCECCGDNSRTVWGLVHLGNSTEAAYFVHWSLGKVPEKGAHVDLILGPWGEGTERADRYAVSLEFRRGFGVRVIDAGARNISRHSLVGRGLAREDVIMTPLAQEVFEIIDAIWIGDERIAEVTGEVR
ncbi:MAG: hypothetical protein ACREQP_24095 [Candidatus Binatia bacterium]